MYVPDSNVSSSPATLRNVVFPEPDGPITDTNSPGVDVQREVFERVGLDRCRCGRSF